jgi:hypothetical protein
LIDQEPVRLDVAVPEVVPISGEGVIAVASGKGLSGSKEIHDGLELSQAPSAFAAGWPG